MARTTDDITHPADDMPRMVNEIAIIGSPNCGKTTLFNKLTGASQRTGNWPGVTVERKDGRLTLPSGQKVTVVDLPGIYSLHDDVQGVEARVAQRYLKEQNPALVIVVLDATRLARQLSLLPDLIATGKPILLVVNMLDSAKAEGITVDLEALATGTGLPTLGVVSSTGDGVAELKGKVQQLLQAYPLTSSHFEVAELAQRVYRPTGQTSRTQKIDYWLLHPIYALPFFLLVMYLLFTVAVNLGAVFIDFFDIVLGSFFVEGTRWLAASAGLPAGLQAILADGIGGGIQLVGTFIPVIGCLYLCMSALEDSGYLSRAAFVIDRMMAKIGLPGQAFIPLIIGFGCNVPAVMAARALGQESARLTTIFIAPFMSCGARLSVYVFVGTAFFPSQAQNAIFALYLLGILVAIGSAWLLRRRLFNDMQGSTIVEMPAYHRPLLRNVLTQTWHRLYSFMWRAGKRILAVVLILNVFSSLGTDGSWGNQDSEQSMLSATGKVMTPLFVPLGVGDDNWPATVGLFTGLFAKEVVVGTLDTLYSPVNITEGNDVATVSAPNILGDTQAALLSVWQNFKDLSGALLDPLGLGAVEEAAHQAPESYAAMLSLFPSAWGAFCYLVFILLYAPCVATIGVMQKEAGHVWLGFSIVWSLLLSYWLASNLWHFSLLLSQPVTAFLWIAGSTVALLLSYRFIMLYMQRDFKDRIAAVNI